MLSCDDQRDFCRRIPHKLKPARERKIVAGRVLTVRHCVVGHAAAHMCFQGRSVRYRCYAIPAACVRDADEEREQPQPESRGGEAPSMAAQQQLRHGFLRAMRLEANNAVNLLTVRQSHKFLMRNAVHLRFRCMTTTTAAATTATSRIGTQIPP